MSALTDLMREECERVTARGAYLIHLARVGETTALCGAVGMTNLFRAQAIYEPYSECEDCKRAAS